MKKFRLGFTPMNMIKLSIKLLVIINPGGDYERH